MTFKTKTFEIKILGHKYTQYIFVDIATLQPWGEYHLKIMGNVNLLSPLGIGKYSAFGLRITSNYYFFYAAKMQLLRQS